MTFSRENSQIGLLLRHFDLSVQQVSDVSRLRASFSGWAAGDLVRAGMSSNPPHHNGLSSTSASVSDQDGVSLMKTSLRNYMGPGLSGRSLSLDCNVTG